MKSLRMEKENPLTARKPGEDVAGAHLLMTNVAPSVWQAQIWPHPQVIGRFPENDIVIPGAYSHVSRQHALIRSNGNEILIQDLGSSGGTQLNSVPLVADLETRCQIGDRLSLAGLEIYIVSHEAAIFDSDSVLSGIDFQIGGTSLRMGRRRSIQSLDDARLRCLSPAELEVVRWVCRGLISDEEIGQVLFRSPHTVRTQLGSVYKKLDVHSREELLSWIHRSEISWTQQPDVERDDSLFS